MNTVALITDNDAIKSQWKFDRIMAAIAYDVDLSIVFMCEGCKQITTNKAWKCLSMYGVDRVYFYHENHLKIESSLFEVRPLTKRQLKQLISNAETLI